MFVYVVTASEFCQKIGISNNPASRLASLRTGHYQNLKLVFTVETPHAEWAEAQAHKAMEKWRIRGEWFAVQASLAVDYVQWAVNASLGWDFKPFAEGERVLCLHEETEHPDLGPGPTPGEIYTVSKVYSGEGEWGLDLAELTNDDLAWHPGCFRRLAPSEQVDLTKFFPKSP